MGKISNSEGKEEPGIEMIIDLKYSLFSDFQGGVPRKFPGGGGGTSSQSPPYRVEFPEIFQGGGDVLPISPIKRP